MEPRVQADAVFSDRAFLLRQAMSLGYGRGALAHPRWHRPFSGMRSKQPSARRLYGRALQYLPRLRPGERFSHATALAVLGCPIRVPKNTPVDVSSPAEIGRVTCRGVRGHRHVRETAPFLCAVPEGEESVPIVPPLRAVQQAAGSLPFVELVVALDHLLREDDRRFDPFTRVHPDELTAFAATTTGRGARRFREAAALARIGSESRMETLMRLAGVRVGMPELRLQVELYDASGGWIGRFDAVDDETRSIFEYDGEQHVTSARQRRRDPRKHQAARDSGWRLLVFFHEDLLESLADAGRRMLEFSGRSGRPVRPSLSRLLDERSGDDTESAVPRRNAHHGPAGD
ncbi:hypothetical protein [Leucobacter sp.]